jgi:asparagine synthase (glutamine-hydrolysing)
VPGLCGIAGISSDSASPLKAMLAHLCRYPWHEPASTSFAGGAFGHVHVAGAGVDRGPAFASEGQISVAFDGELYEPAGERAADAQRAARGVLEHGLEYFRRVHGCFTCAIWDSTARTVTLVTDRFGMRPLFWAVHGGRLVFASEVGAVTAGGVSEDPSVRGAAEFLAFGQFIGDTTLYEHVRAAPAAAIVRFTPATGEAVVRTYAEEPAIPELPDEEWLEQIDAAFAASVARCCEGGGRLGLSLSGGLDARTILAVAPDDARIECVSLGIPGSIDLRAAERMARLTRQPFHAHHLDGDFLSQFEPLFREVVRLTDGHYLDQGIVLTTLQGYRDLGINTLLRGHAGELLHMTKAYAFSMDGPAAAISTREQLRDWLWRHLSGYMLGQVDEEFFRGTVGARIRELARDTLDRALARWDHVEPVPQRIWRLFLEERLRRETAMSLQMFRSFVEVRLPYLEPRLVNALLAAPVRLKLGDAIQSYVLRKRKPEFLRVVNANTGAPLGASHARAQLATLRMKVFAKLGVRGYQPYERLGLWLARDLQPMLRRTIQDDAFLSSGWFDAGALERVIAQHRSRERNHTFLQMALLVLASAAVRQPAGCVAVG